MKGTRDGYIDFLRFLGVTLVMIAHVNAPFMVNQVRSFDVPLMVFVSGLCFSGREVSASWSKFFWPRIKRLLIPVYIILALYFCFLYVAHIKTTPTRLIYSVFLLNDGVVGYVWIIRVFLLIMLFTPLMTRISRKLSGTKLSMLLVAIAIVNELACTVILGMDTSSIIGLVVYNCIPFSLAYGIVFLIGLKTPELCERKKKQVLIIAIILGIICHICLYLTGADYSIFGYKYPPRFPYYIYGIVVCLLLWTYRLPSVMYNSSFSKFVGRNTIWIYLWHIFMLVIANNITHVWYCSFLLVYFGAIIIFYIQYKSVAYLKTKKDLAIFKYLVG